MLYQYWEAEILLFFSNIFISDISEQMKCQRYASKRCACVQQSEAELMVMQPSIQGISELCLYNPFNTIWTCTITVYNIIKLQLARDSMSKIYYFHPILNIKLNLKAKIVQICDVSLLKGYHLHFLVQGFGSIKLQKNVSLSLWQLLDSQNCNAIWKRSLNISMGRKNRKVRLKLHYLLPISTLTICCYTKYSFKFILRSYTRNVSLH